MAVKGVTFLLCMAFTLYKVSSSATARLSLVDWNQYHFHEPNGPGTYAFGYDIDDPGTDNVQFRNEEKFKNGTVSGSYGYVDPDGKVRIVHYIADENGYRATEENNDLKTVNKDWIEQEPFRWYFSRVK